MARASDRAYGSVRRPAEGTILTVVREMAHRIATELAHMPQARLTEDSVPDEQDALLALLLESAIDAGEESVKRGPELLPVLREAGVVDAGGYGLVIMFAGVVAALRGEALRPLEHFQPGARHPSAPPLLELPLLHELRGHRREPAGRAVDRGARADRRLRSRGRRRAHAQGPRPHDDPEEATRLFDDAAVSRLDVADMQLQMAQRAGRLGNGVGKAAACGVLAVVAGDGMAELFASLGAVPLDGGQTLNPSTYDLLAGIHGVPAEEVVVLPNSGNVIMAAERAAELSDKTVRVVRVRSQQAGLAAACRARPLERAAENAAAMGEALPTCAPAPYRRARDDAPARRASAAATRSASSRGAVAGATPAETLEACSASCPARRAGHADRGRRRAARGEQVAALAPTASSSSTRSAASPPTGG
jgi:dihydroxyacetone kinase-like predicted kinase